MKNVKRLKREDRTDTRSTRTLLVSGIRDKEENELIRNLIGRTGSVKEIYTIQDSHAILFAIMYDIREAEKLFKTLKSQGKNLVYTVSKYEIPREVDRCDDTKNQGTLLLVSRDLDVPFTEDEVHKLFEEFGDIKCIREYKSFQRFIEFYDSRSAVAAYKRLHEKEYGKGTIIIRFVWDMTNKQRWAMIGETDRILKSLALENKKSTEKGADMNRKIYEKNVILKSLDDFIVRNLDKLER